MKKRYWIFLCALVLCAGIFVVVEACSDDEECKECTNSVTGEKKTYCGDNLKEAKLMPNVTCK